MNKKHLAAWGKNLVLSDRERATEMTVVNNVEEQIIRKVALLGGVERMAKGDKWQCVRLPGIFE